MIAVKTIISVRICHCH